ncbi:MAG: hypothetical protein R3E66_11990 [bacterium]
MRAHISVICLALLASSCVELEPSQGSNGATSTRTQAVTVVPRFELINADKIPDVLYLTQLGLVVSEIRLTPIVTKNYGLAYATANASVLKFDLANGEKITEGSPIELPESGRYVVSIRLEPLESTTEGEAPSSLSVDGFVAQATDVTNPGKVADGTPLPLPFEPKKKVEGISDSSATPVTWTPFQYSSQRAVFYTMNDVELEAGEQTLQFQFDVQDWAEEVADPISKAIKNNPNTLAQDGVDVTRQVESTGVGVESLIQTAVVSRDVPGR